jgi:transcriptional regulator GlxA family with amidase domain
MDIELAAIDRNEVVADGLTFGALSDLETIEACDIPLVPGGLGCIAALETPSFLAAIRRLAEGAAYVTPVCTGSLMLAAAGLLTGRRAAIHWASSELFAAFGAVPDAGRVVRDRNRITGGGVTAGIDFTLSLIAELRGDEAAQGAQLLMEYAPEPPFDAGAPETPPRPVMDAGHGCLSNALADAERGIAIVAEQLRHVG